MIRLFPPTAQKPADAIWVDLFNPTSEEVKDVSSALSLTIPERDALEEIESSSRLQEENGIIQLSLPVSSHQNDDGPTPIGFVLSKKFLVSIRYTEMHAFDVAATQCTKEAEPLNTSGDVFTALIEGMVDYGADMLEKIAGSLNSVSKDVFRRYGSTRHHNIARSNRRMRETLVTVGTDGEKLSQIRDSILGLQRIVPYAADKAKTWIGDDLALRLKTVVQDLQSLSDFETHLSNKVQFLLDAVLGFINIEQNDIFKVLTIVSVVGIPPTFFASMWGMNFKNMPEYDWHFGYPMALCVIIASTLVPVIWFKLRGWW